jgi:retron-type reverse transcriptase
MSLETPEKIRTLQRKLYRKAKAEPAFRFYVLYDKICREDILRHAYELARSNAGAPGVDGVSFAQIEERGLEVWLAGLREELVLKTYRPDPVRRVIIPMLDNIYSASKIGSSTSLAAESPGRGSSECRARARLRRSAQGRRRSWRPLR